MLAIKLPIFFALLAFANPCGIVTHTGIAERARAVFSSAQYSRDYVDIIKRHLDAYQAGNPYPDSYYSGLCKNGDYSDVSEDTHWAPFLNATINYIRTKPTPWDEKTEKLVAFTFGFASHQIADVLWHNLGDTTHHGFLQEMANNDFTGDFDTAHSWGDFGGDVIGTKVWNTTFIDEFPIWYIPIDDLVNIYDQFYGQHKIGSETILECTQIMYWARVGELLAIRVLYLEWAGRSPFMVEQFHDYYIGGVNDMAAWSARYFNFTAFLLDHGTQMCNFSNGGGDMFDITCSLSEFVSQKGRRRYNEKYSEFLTEAIKQAKVLLGDDSLQLKMANDRSGMTLDFTDSAKIALETILKEKVSVPKAYDLTISEGGKTANTRYSYDFDGRLTSATQYSNFGWATARIQISGTPHLAIGSPDWGMPGLPQAGRVYIVELNDQLLSSDQNVESIAKYILQPDSVFIGKFGFSLETLDINGDGFDDLAVGAPSSGGETRNLNYHGVAMVFLGGEDGLNSTAGLTFMTREPHTNLGFTMKSFRATNASTDSLLFGCPYAAVSTGALLLGSNDGSLSNLTTGQQRDQWFGYTLALDYPRVYIGAPNTRICQANVTCTPSEATTQGVGAVYMYNLETRVLEKVLAGERRWDKLGFSLAISDDSPRKLAVGSPSRFVKGGIFGEFVPVVRPQSGHIDVYDVGQNGSLEKSAFGSGGRMLGHFGFSLRFGKQVQGTGSGDSLLVGAPFWTADPSVTFYGGEEGKLYLFRPDQIASDMTHDCGYFSPRPCPSKSAQLDIQGDPKHARIGWISDIFQSSDQSDYLATSAIHGAERARMAGDIYFYKINN